jgi:hypothetical protein
VADVVLVAVTVGAGSAGPARVGPVREPQCRKHDGSQAHAEAPQRLPPRDRLRETLGQFIEILVHNFPFVLFVVVLMRQPRMARITTDRRVSQPSHYPCPSVQSVVQLLAISSRFSGFTLCYRKLASGLQEM